MHWSTGAESFNNDIQRAYYAQSVSANGETWT